MSKIQKQCRVVGCKLVGVPKGQQGYSSLCRWHYKNGAEAVHPKQNNMNEDNLSDLNNLGHKEVTEDFSDSPFADRIEPDTIDPSQFPAEGSDIEDLRYF